MGTRHLIGVVLDGDFKVAQYGQWDGYPGGQGATILDFLTNPDMKIQNFIEQVRRLEWITPERIREVEVTDNWPKVYPWLSRDAGAEVLTHIYNGEAHATGLQNSWAFGFDSLFCEWGWVIDLDNAKLEVYKGFHHGPVQGRWAVENPTDEGTEGYDAITLIKTYDLAQLPSLDVLIKECDPDDVDDD